jgi:hypothetical protein
MPTILIAIIHVFVWASIRTITIALITMQNIPGKRGNQH